MEKGFLNSHQAEMDQAADTWIHSSKTDVHICVFAMRYFLLKGATKWKFKCFGLLFSCVLGEHRSESFSKARFLPHCVICKRIVWGYSGRQREASYSLLHRSLQVIMYHQIQILVILRQWISGEHPRNLAVHVVSNMLPAGVVELYLPCFAVEHYCPSHHELLPRGCCHLQRDSERIKRSEQAFTATPPSLLPVDQFLLSLHLANGHSSHHLYHGVSPWMC